ncbi:MAG: hypothetical protein A2249_04320 [Candidatus Jacksonbacteria bacterium RIFOXYA2_FULL_44_7]|uniref:UDP-N-acetylglucosamine--N-acetylmuramyl-(pentapeptide) pyrophosphoryl-undecaprenol N-acetylglucosamine transferase n=1 Tax=Candidatus Jacksonbacteria bacterium RIFCSPLOWO2_02_FULL_44_20 TaxID=1798460 RepID=A0A1G2A9N6_9BACT|nr:MAG: UDP-N-acetylglucosamine-N-acetylmuramyl- (pentapeptide) pyrophosphoryl-UDP N- acetylglucosamine transferase [Parcubacteria group bacterium GW2011_GWC2_44_17]KKT48094.1 MAG: UDP-N-acetylglucosamine-N-acetylmuramyl- (pentapeptide) pyrophosphoryl-UDP N- acetylglucosamine transferase [Parcubacteria group bacterium GW2011_GWF2_44_17]OGY70992.1 MAG: hypothetical protein A3E05_00750 [Candidatus Jacksonbacteria bacterium RIFCSPHIGHO2_12_FULL_44_12]OGY73623.1 MAG: hypothetical protein A3H61_00325
MRILFVGGGTLGSVSPLIAIFEDLQKSDARVECLWVGTKNGPERAFIAGYNITYRAIPAGKLRRYFSFKNFADILFVFQGFCKSVLILINFRPDIIIGAGSFVQVPILLAAKCFFRKTKIIIHQQDITPGLANRLSAKWAHVITVSTEQSLNHFQRTKSVFTGNPYRKEIAKGDISRAFDIFKLEPKIPTILVLGGGSGAVAINKLLTRAIPKLAIFCQIIHLTGTNKEDGAPKNISRYHAYEFLTSFLKDAYAVADLVISRAGFATITELAALAKPSIIIPIPDTHQEENALWLSKNRAAVIMPQKTLTPNKLSKGVREIIENKEESFRLSSNISTILPKDSNEKFLQVMIATLEHGIRVKKW